MIYVLMLAGLSCLCMRMRSPRQVGTQCSAAIIITNRIAVITTNRIAVITINIIAVISINRIAIITINRVASITIDKIAIITINIIAMCHRTAGEHCKQPFQQRAGLNYNI